VLGRSRSHWAHARSQQAGPRGAEHWWLHPSDTGVASGVSGAHSIFPGQLIITLSPSKGFFSIASIRASNPVFSRVRRPAMRTWQRWSRTSVGGSSARSAGWATWKPAWMCPWPLGMIRFSTPHQSLPAPWRLRSSRVSPVAHGLESQCAASARALALQANGLHS
jgi:hypothetical protein